MFFNKKSSATNGRVQAPHTPSPSQQHGTKLIREAWWLALILLGLYLAVVLMTYSREDSSWSHMANESAVVHNAGGAVGAYIADMLLYLFGFSAWWWVVLAQIGRAHV